MHVGAFFNVPDGTLDIVCDCFDLLLHLCMELGFFLLLCFFSLTLVVVGTVLTATFS